MHGRCHRFGGGVLRALWHLLERCEGDYLVQYHHNQRLGGIMSIPIPTYSARITTECFYPSLTVMKYDEFFVENSWMLPTGFTVFSGEAKYNWLNDNGYWVSGEFDDAINDPRVEAEGGEQDEVVIHIDELYA